MLAQEAARIIVNHGVRDYRLAKTKAAERLGFTTRASLPGNAEVERAVSEHLALFGRESHADFLLVMRRIALSAMDLLETFTPRLVGPVLHGTADTNITMDQFAGLANALEEKGVPHEMITYSGAPHAFTVFGEKSYQESADQKSWKRFQEFLAETLKN